MEQKVHPIKKADTATVVPVLPPKPELKIKYGMYSTGDSAVVKDLLKIIPTAREQLY